MGLRAIQNISDLAVQAFKSCMNSSILVIKNTKTRSF